MAVTETEKSEQRDLNAVIPKIENAKIKYFIDEPTLYESLAVLHDSEEPGTQIVLRSDITPEFINVVRAVNMEMGGTLKKDIAVELGVVDRTISRQFGRWEDDGLLQKAVAAILRVAGQRAKMAELSTVNAWPEILLSIYNLATKGNSEKVKLDAAAWLYINIVKPQIETIDAMQDIAAQAKPRNYDEFDPASVD